MGKALIQDSPTYESDKGKIEGDTIYDKNNSPGKKSQPITDIHGNDSSTRTSIEGYDKYVSQDKEIDIDKKICTKKRNRQFLSNNSGCKRSYSTLSAKNYLIHTLAQKYRDKSSETGTDGRHGSSPVPQQRHGSMYFKNKTFMEAYLALEGVEVPSTILDSTVFQKKDCLRQINKDVTSYLDKCSWHEPSKQESDDEASLLNDNDIVEAELSTSDTFSKEVEDLASESSGPYSEEISIVQTSGESVSGNEDTEDSSTDDDCESGIDENVEDSMFLVHNDEQQALVPVFIYVIEDDAILDQHLALVNNEDAFIEEGSCHDETNDGLSGSDQSEVASQQNKLVMPSFYDFYEATTPTDYSTKHHMLTSNGYSIEVAEDALVVMNIPQNPVQPRLQDDADQEPYQADHLRDNSTDQTDSVEQDEDMFMFTLSLSVSLEAPQVMEESPIHSFSASSENSLWSMLGGGQEEMSNFTDTESEDDEESDYSLSSLFDLALNVDDLNEQLDIS